MASLNINDHLLDFAQRQAAEKGLPGPAAYVEDLLAEAEKHAVRTNGHSLGPSLETVSQALQDLDRLRIGNRLNGLSIRDLIDEGRRL